jgi:phosphoglycerate dehydrogenase-like enzyme
VLFHLPKSMLEHCFAARDLEQLSPTYKCHFPASDEESDLYSAWETHASEATVVVTGWDSPRITCSMLAVTPNLEAIVHAAGSIRAFIPASVWDSSIRIATANDALGKGVAETTMGFIIAALKGFFPCAQLTRSGSWQSAIPEKGFGRVRELYDVKIGIIGASRTGRPVLRLLEPHETDVLLYDPTIDAVEAETLGATSVDLDELMRLSDVVSLHAPALPSLRHMLGASQFALMKDDAILINTARGMLIDESALVNELTTGRISAILDVTVPEPPDPASPLRHLPNVTLLPHIAGALTTGCKRMGRSVVDQLLEFAAGEPMHGEISRERFAVMA